MDLIRRKFLGGNPHGRNQRIDFRSFCTYDILPKRGRGLERFAHDYYLGATTLHRNVLRVRMLLIVVVVVVDVTVIIKRESELNANPLS